MNVNEVNVESTASVDSFEAGIDETSPLKLSIDEDDIYSLSDTYTNNSHRGANWSDPNTLLGMGFVGVATFCLYTTGVIAQDYSTSICQLLMGRYLFQHIFSWMTWFALKIVINRTNNHSNSNYNTISDNESSKNESLLWQFRYIVQDWNNDLIWYGNEGHRMGIWLRSLLYWISVLFWWYGLQLIEIGDVVALEYTYPIFTVILAKLVLNESIPSSFWITLGLNIAAVIMVAQPSFVLGLILPDESYSSLSPIGVTLILCCAMSYAWQSIVIRQTKQAHWLQFELVNTFACTFVLTPLLMLIEYVLNFYFYIDFSDVDSNKWQWNWDILRDCIVTASLGFFGLMCNIIGYQVGDATKVTFVNYLGLVFGYGYQILLFGDVPNIFKIIGIILLVLTSIIHVVEECCFTHAS